MLGKVWGYSNATKEGVTPTEVRPAVITEGQ